MSDDVIWREAQSGFPWDRAGTAKILRYPEPVKTFRVLLSDGRCIDVQATRDDSDLRAWVLEQAATKNDGVRIAGVAELPEQESML